MLLACYPLALAAPGLANQMTTSTRNFRKAAWMWKPHLYQDDAGKQRMLETIRRWDLSDLYVQWNGNPTELERIARAVTGEGARVWALGGEPEWGTGEAGARAAGLRLIDEVAEYNQARQADDPAQVVGVHYDVEPYALPQWSLQRTEILRAWTEFSLEAAQHARHVGLRVGFSMPAWEPEGELAPTGANPSFFESILSHADEVAVMSYRTKLSGINGALHISSRVGEAAARLRANGQAGAEILIGAETTKLSTSTVRLLTAVRPPAAPGALPLRDEEGRRIVLLNHGRAWMLGLAVSETTSPAFPRRPEPAGAADLLALAKATRFPVTAEPEVLRLATAALRSCEGFERGHYREVVLPRSGNAAEAERLAHLPPVIVIEAEENPPHGVSFYGQDAGTIKKTLDVWKLELEQTSPQIRGLAIHDFEALSRLGHLPPPK